MAEGSFYIKKSGVVGFSVCQLNHSTLLLALNLVFGTNKNLSVDNGVYQYDVSSKKDINSVIQFFSLSGVHPMIGYKAETYDKWILALKNSARYKNLSHLKMLDTNK
jgi:hypothetical protein